MASRSEVDLSLFREKQVNDPTQALRLLATEVKGCTRCDLYKNATQTVFGEGPADAALMLVGEQPGDQEELRGARREGARQGAGESRDRAPKSTSPTR
jgi:DNA polymerase